MLATLVLVVLVVLAVDRVAVARQLAMYLMHVALGWQYAEVGQFFGRDRTTVPKSR